jgi:2-aminoadipate transaminase
MQTDLLESRLRTGLKFIYVLPNFQNPTGVTLSRERRVQLVEMANAYGVPIVEDDPYGQLRYEGEHIPPVVVLDDEIRAKEVPVYSGNVIYTSTFSKILAPGLRLAWVVAPSDVIKKLVQAKQGCDLNTSTFNQYLAYEVANGPWMKTHINKIRETYKERRDVMLKALEEYMPEGVNWTRPKGGLFLWATLPESMDSSTIFPLAVEQKVAFVPGTSFHPLGGGENTMRLNFSCMKPDLINEGIKRLANVIKDNL